MRQSLLVRNTAAMLAGSGARLLIQGIYFILIARALGAEQYGAFIGVVALVAILSPFASFGTGQILVRKVARDRTLFDVSWGNALWTTGVVGSLLLGLLLLVSKSLLASRISLQLVFLIGSSDLLMGAVVAVAALAFQAVEQLHRTAEVYVVLTGARAASALILIVAFSHPTALVWGWLYLLSSTVAAVCAVTLVCVQLGRPALCLERLRSELLEGFYFSVSLSSASIYNNIDKTMLVRLATFGAAGIYGAAYRVVDFAFQPVNALLFSTFPRFFRHGKEGLPGTRRLARRFLPFTAAYAVLAGAVLIVLAPAVPLVLGKGFSESVEALRWLCPIVLFRSLHYFLADALTGAGFQGTRSAIQIVVAGLNVVLNLWLIPVYSWRGAAWASLACDGALVFGMAAGIAVLGRGKTTSNISCGTEPESFL